MSSTLVFEEAEYVKPQGTGRNREPNPYTDVIASIALKTDEKTGKPVARKFRLEHDGAEGERDKAVAKMKRQMSDAGGANNPPVSVISIATPVKNPVNGTESATKTNVIFWTVARQVRKRETVEATAEQSAE